MKVFHGSTVSVAAPLVGIGRKNLDFGKGFYTTMLAEQAERWATIKKERSNAPKAIVSIYEIDVALLTDAALHIREFHGVDEAWLNFVVGCRKENAPNHEFDLVFGPVANDNVFLTVNLYETGAIDVMAAIAQLRAYRTYDQLSFHTERVVAALRFVESYEVKG